MSKTYDEYIAPVMKNMDSATQKHLLYRFSTIYKLNPQTMFRMKSKKEKEDIIRNFYWCVTQLYCPNYSSQILVIANAGQGEIVDRLKKQAATLPVPSIDMSLDILTKLAENSTISSSIKTPVLQQPKIKDYIKDFGRRLILR